MFSFLKKKAEGAPKADTQAHFAPAPGTEIRYSPELIPQLQGDHAALLALYGEIQQAFGAENYPEVSRQLNEFRTLLQGHLLTENVRLYIYLDRMLGRDEMNGELIREFRKEMDGIGRTVMNFLKKYDAIGVDKELAGAFKKDFDVIGAVLVQRVNREESTLYPLYLPNY
jgi:hypothetical protein